MIASEDAARANFYGLIARLFYAPPDAQLVAQLLQAGPMQLEAERNAEGEALAAAWGEMLDACRTAFPAALENEHTELFVGTGKAAVTPYLSHYVLRHSNDSPLVDLRAQLGAWGIARREDVPEYEDHVSGVCETMRFVIAVQQRSPEEQQAFFDRFVYRGTAAFCDAVSASSQARFYRPVARFARTFLEVEKSAFEMGG
jgi:TorA maturation chaperone TorD